MRRILFCLAVLALVFLVQPASAQPSAKAAARAASAASKPAQPVELSTFLASLSGQQAHQARQAISGGEVTNYCPPNYCNELKLECAESCAPCGWAATCYYYVCDAACYCYC